MGDSAAGERRAIVSSGRGTHDEDEGGSLEPTPTASLPPAPPERPRRTWRVAVMAALPMALLWGLTLAGRMDRSPAAWLVAAVLVLPWLHALSWALLGGLLLVCRRSRWLLALLCLHLALALAAGGGSCAVHWLPSRERSLPPRGDLRLLTWNVGRMGVWASEEEGRCTLAATREGVRATIAREEPGVLVLLEITGARLEALAADAGLDCVGTDYRGEGRRGVGGLGVCVPSEGRWRISQSRDLALPPDWRYVFAELSDGEHAFNVLALHVRPYGVTPPELDAALHDLLRGRRGPLGALLAELERAVAGQADQVAEVRALVAGFHDPTVLAGDFNSPPDSAVHASLRRQLRDAWEVAGHGAGSTRTVGRWLPLRIDYAYTSEGLDALDARVVDCRCAGGLACSDHRALVVDLALAP
ncbi:MAG: endonuclease/exonuclease/phosphatase family protein [Pseudomonadota bacterium]